NLDWYTGFYGTGVGTERIRTALGIYTDMTPKLAQELRDAINGGHIDLMPIYIAEGKRADNESKSEFALLLNAQLLTARTAVVHGVALGSSDFDQMQAAGSVLVWSPRSNVELYGETADVASAVRAGVPVLLAPDWSPTG